MLPLGNRLPSPTPCNYPYHQALRASFLPRWGEEAFGLAVCIGDTHSQSLPCAKGEVGKRVRSAHNAEGVSDPQCRAEASTKHGSGLYAD